MLSMALLMTRNASLFQQGILGGGFLCYPLYYDKINIKLKKLHKMLGFKLYVYFNFNETTA